jgi:hypothetical protein
LPDIFPTCTIYFPTHFNHSQYTVVMSPPTMNTSIHNTSSHYTPSDTVDRHDYGVQKNRKPASTGGGRAWSEDEVSGSHEYIMMNHSAFKSNILHRKSTSFRHVYRKCLTSTSLPISRRPSSHAVCTIINFPTEATAANAPLLFPLVLPTTPR